MEAIGPLACAGELREELLAGMHRLLGIVVEGDVPAGIREHQRVMMGDVHEMQERFLARTKAEKRMSGGVAGGGLDRDRSVQ